MLDIHSTPGVVKNFRGQIEQSQCFIEIEVSEKTRIRCYLGAVKFYLKPPSNPTLRASPCGFIISTIPYVRLL
jgi:hypothetical protein